MNAWALRAKLLLAMTAVLVCARASTSAGYSQLTRRMPPAGGSRSPLQQLDFTEVYTGSFQPSSDIRVVPPEMIPWAYSHMFFYHGKPVFVFYDNLRIPHHDLDVAFKTFKRFYIYDIQTRTEASIIPDPHRTGAAIPSRTDDGLHAYIQHAIRIRGEFGEHVSLVAHGLAVQPGPTTTTFFGGTRPKAAPSWRKVWESEPRRQGTVPAEQGHQFRANVRRQLNTDRQAHFLSSDGTKALGLRALPDGQIEFAVKYLEAAHP